MDKKVYYTVLVICVIFTGIWYLNKDVELKDDEIEIDGKHLVYRDVNERDIVYITGEVVNPSVYEIESGLRIKDLIEIAGGPTEYADLEAINLAEYIDDGSHYVVPSKSQEEILESKGGLIDINKASVYELTVLPNIGETTAKSIVEYRNANGPFIKIDDIMNVPGIGQGTFNQIRSKISVN